MQLAQKLPQFKEQVYEKHKTCKDEKEPACDLRPARSSAGLEPEARRDGRGEERVWL